MAQALEKMSKSRLASLVQRGRSTLANIRDGAEKAAVRSIVLGAASGGGYGTGWLRGRARRDNWAIGFGAPEGATGFQPTATSYTLVGGAALGLGGALGSSFLGDSFANLALGLGAGMVAADLGFIGERHGNAAAGT